ncbi:stage II sporulation protein M [Microbacterium oleivorans]|uniref:Stage II sporulation protein M n=1 Tax=Microbacterium oleivorans TaxID=273677 RepID=A0A031FW22_9MICO|nr:stage II sporulation protein M [Microbacterium oleivorans]EZP28396.1 hypothetical protein BW34_01376 [Microbacterium oleivorans]
MTSSPASTLPAAAVPFWRRPFRLIRDNRRVYLLLNVATYGVFIVGFLVGLVFPDLRAAQAQGLEDDGTGDLVRSVFANPPLFAALILGVNVFRLSLLTIVLPSLVVPFAGLALFGYWVAETGITLAPDSPTGWVALIPHSLTLIIELQAYILFVLGAWLLGRNWVRPRAVGESLHRRGYVRGLQSIGLLALPALILLVIGALWEAYSLRYLIHPLSQWLLG